MRYCSSLARRGTRGRAVLCQAAVCEAASPATYTPARLIASFLTWTVILTCTVIAYISTAGSARAELVRDTASGLIVVPPEGYNAARMAPTETFTARISVKKSDDRDTGCQVAFTPLPQNAGHTQDQLNSVMASRSWLDLARASLTVNYDVIDVTPFVHGNVHGVMLIGDLKQRAGIPPRSQEVRTLFFILETPKGRTTTICVGEKANFDARRNEFEAVVHGVTLAR
jgi:hypothetical protein